MKLALQSFPLYNKVSVMFIDQASVNKPCKPICTTPSHKTLPVRPTMTQPIRVRVRVRVRGRFWVMVLVPSLRHGLSSEKPVRQAMTDEWYLEET